MNTYLLLRDNKQTGPYTQEDIVTKGLKPYDLVWVEGKSAAWRYPSEIAELKPFAPVVEEQPYDRFYKKNVQHDVEETPVKEKNYVQQEVNAPPLPASEKQANEKQVIAIPAKSKKIYVTLPVTASRNAAAQASLQEVERPLKSEKKAEPKVEAYAPKPVSQAASTAPIPDYPDFDDVTTKNGDHSFAGILEKKHSQQPTKPDTLRTATQQNERRRRSIISLALAACLLLGGIAIGFVLSNTTATGTPKTTSENKNIAQQPVTNEAAPANQPVTQQAVKNGASAPLAISRKADTVTTPPPVIGKKSKAAGATRNRDTARPVVGQVNANTHDVAISETPAKKEPVKSVKKEDAPARSEASLETAMKNIYQQVKVAGSKYRTGVLGGISDLHLTISNNSPYSLDEVEVEVKYLNPDKRVVKTQMMLFSDVSAGTQKVLDVPRSSRGVSVDYSITRIHAKALGLAHADF